MGQSHPQLATAENVFLYFYTFELFFKLTVHGMYFFRNEDGRLNTFDFVLVLLGWFDFLMSQGFSAGLFRSVRIFRIGKAFRAFKVVAQFDRLKAFATCLQQSFGTLFWCLMMLFVVFYLFTLVFLQLVGIHLSNPDITISEEEQVEIADFYGSVWGSMLTLWMAVSGGDDWGNAFNAIRLTGTSGAIIFLIFISFTVVALMNLIMGFFVEGAMEVFSKSGEQAALDHEEQQQLYRSQLERLCKDMDEDSTSCLSREQFKKCMDAGSIPRLLTLLGMDRTHVERLFNILSYCSSSDGVNISEFVSGCMALRGSAKQFDLQIVFMEMRKMHQETQNVLADVSSRVRRLEADKCRLLD
jgi:hypothetical protein